MFAIDLSKQQALDADPKAIQRINFTGILARDPVANTTMFFIIGEAKETPLDFHKELWKYCNSILPTRYNTLTVKLSNSQLNKLKSGIKNGTEVTLKLLSNIVGDANDENNFPHKLLLTQVSKLCKAFANGSSANMKLSKT